MENVTRVAELIQKRKRSFGLPTENLKEEKLLTSNTSKGCLKYDNTPGRKFQKCIKQKENLFGSNNKQKRVHFALDC